MKKTGEDQPPKASPSQQDLLNLAKQKPRADQDTDYQHAKKHSKLPKKNK